MNGKVMDFDQLEEITNQLKGVADLICSLMGTAETSKVTPNALEAVADLLYIILQDLQEQSEEGDTGKAGQV